jgi:hypothetical protein
LHWNVSELYQDFEAFLSFFLWRNNYTHEHTTRLTFRSWFVMVTFLISPLARLFYFFRAWLYFAMMRDPKCDFYKELHWFVLEQQLVDADAQGQKRAHVMMPDAAQSTEFLKDEPDRNRLSMSSDGFEHRSSCTSVTPMDIRSPSGDYDQLRNSSDFVFLPTETDENEASSSMERVVWSDGIEVGSFVRIHRRPLLGVYQQFGGGGKPELVDWDKEWINRLGEVVETGTVSNHCRVRLFGVAKVELHLPAEALDRLPTKRVDIDAKQEIPWLRKSGDW